MSSSGAAGAFRAVVGREPEGVWAAPGRVNLIGEHTDYNDGFVLPLALPQRVVVAAARRSDDQLVLRTPTDRRAVSLDSLAPGAVDGWAAYPAGVAWALREAGHTVGGVDMLVDGDVPVGAGLSSSAALECATALAFDELFALGIDRPTLARLAQRAENDFVGMPCGIMDQSASLLCTAGHALFLDTRAQSATQVPLDLDAAGLALLVVDTRAPHQLVDGAYADRRASCEAAARALGVTALRDASLDDVERLTDPTLQRRARHVVTENARVLDTVGLLLDGRPRDVGPLLTASHASLRDDFEVTVPQLDVAVDAALAAGAHGARMTGGGFGGCIIALVDAPAADTVAAAVRDAFSHHGFSHPESFVAHPSAGATRLR